MMIIHSLNSWKLKRTYKRQLKDQFYYKKKLIIITQIKNGSRSPLKAPPSKIYIHTSLSSDTKTIENSDTHLLLPMRT